MHFNARKFIKKQKRKQRKQKNTKFNILKLILFIPSITNTIRLIQLCSGPDILSLL